MDPRPSIPDKRTLETPYLGPNLESKNKINAFSSKNIEKNSNNNHNNNNNSNNNNNDIDYLPNLVNGIDIVSSEYQKYQKEDSPNNVNFILTNKNSNTNCENKNTHNSSDYQQVKSLSNQFVFENKVEKEVVVVDQLFQNGDLLPTGRPLPHSLPHSLPFPTPINPSCDFLHIPSSSQKALHSNSLSHPLSHPPSPSLSINLPSSCLTSNFSKNSISSFFSTASTNEENVVRLDEKIDIQIVRDRNIKRLLTQNDEIKNNEREEENQRLKKEEKTIKKEKEKEKKEVKEKENKEVKERMEIKDSREKKDRKEKKVKMILDWLIAIGVPRIEIGQRTSFLCGEFLSLDIGLLLCQVLRQLDDDYENKKESEYESNERNYDENEIKNAEMNKTIKLNENYQIEKFKRIQKALSFIAVRTSSNTLLSICLSNDVRQSLLQGDSKILFNLLLLIKKAYTPIVF